MANPTPPTSPLTWTRIAPATTAGNPPIGLSWAQAVSSIGTSLLLCADGGDVLVVASSITPDVTSMTWTTLAPAAVSPAAGSVLYAPIEGATPHGVYLSPGGRLTFE